MKLFIKLITILCLFIIYACQTTEEDYTQQLQQIKPKIQHTNLNTLLQDPLFTNISNDLNLLQLSDTYKKANNISLKTSTITLHTNVVKKITLGNITSYNILIERANTANNVVENLVIQDINGTKRSMILKYKFKNAIKNTKYSFIHKTQELDQELDEVEVQEYPPENDGGGGNNCYYETIFIEYSCTGRNHHNPGEYCPCGTIYPCTPPRTESVLAQVCEASNNLTTVLVEGEEVTAVGSNGANPNNNNNGASVFTFEQPQGMADLITQCLTNLTPSQLNWVNNADGDNSVNLYNYINQNGCNPETKEFAEEAIEAIADQTNDIDTLEDFIAEEIEDNIDDTNLDPCSKNILDDIKRIEENGIAQIIKKLGTPSNIYKTEISTNSTVAPWAGANWISENGFIKHYNYRIDISQLHPDNSTNLAIAQTILHELVHVYFFSLIDDCFKVNDCQQLQTFPELWDFYVENKNNNVLTDGTSQHNELANSYTDIIARALQEYDTGIKVNDNDNPEQFYLDLAWGSLKETTPYNNLSKEHQDRIDDVNESENWNTPSYNPSGVLTTTPKGKPCQN